MKLLMQYKNITQGVLLNKAVLIELMSGRKYDVISQYSNCTRGRICVLWISETKSVIETPFCYRNQYEKDPHSYNTITFGDRYSVIKRVIIITADNVAQKL
jgi:hypothetical protein